MRISNNNKMILFESVRNTTLCMNSLANTTGMTSILSNMLRQVNQFKSIKGSSLFPSNIRPVIPRINFNWMNSILTNYKNNTVRSFSSRKQRYITPQYISNSSTQHKQKINDNLSTKEHQVTKTNKYYPHMNNYQPLNVIKNPPNKLGYIFKILTISSGTTALLLKMSDMLITTINIDYFNLITIAGVAGVCISGAYINYIKPKYDTNKLYNPLSRKIAFLSYITSYGLLFTPITVLTGILSLNLIPITLSATILFTTLSVPVSLALSRRVNDKLIDKYHGTITTLYLTSIGLFVSSYLLNNINTDMALFIFDLEINSGLIISPICIIGTLTVMINEYNNGNKDSLKHYADLVHAIMMMCIFSCIYFSSVSYRK